MLRVGRAVACVACKNLVSKNMGVRFRMPLQKLHPLSRAIHHRYNASANAQRPPHCSAARHFTSMSRLPMRPPKPPPGGHGGWRYQQHRNFWMLRLASRLLKLRYIVLGSAVGGGYTAKKTYEEWKDMLPDMSAYNWVIPDFVWELSDQIDLDKLTKILPELEEIAKLLPELPDFDKIGENFTFLKSILSTGVSVGSEGASGLRLLLGVYTPHSAPPLSSLVLFEYPTLVCVCSSTLADVVNRGLEPKTMSSVPGLAPPNSTRLALLIYQLIYLSNRASQWKCHNTLKT